MSVLEIVRYKVKEGVTPEAALAAWEKSQPFAASQPGFVSRKLANTEDGVFADIVEWDTMEAALAVMEEFKVDKHPELADLVAVLDDATIEIQHFTVTGQKNLAMRRTDRLFDLIQFLLDGRLHTASDLAEQMEVSVRTIYRDMDTMVASGIPVEGERGVGYILRAPVFMPPMALTQVELEALHLGAALVR